MFNHLNPIVMLKKVLTMAAVLLSAGWAFTGSATGKSLLQDASWVINGQTGLHSTSSAVNACPGRILDTCAYQVDAQGNPTGDKFYYE